MNLIKAKLQTMTRIPLKVHPEFVLYNLNKDQEIKTARYPTTRKTYRYIHLLNIYGIYYPLRLRDLCRFLPLSPYLFKWIPVIYFCAGSFLSFPLCTLQTLQTPYHQKHPGNSICVLHMMYKTIISIYRVVSHLIII